MVWPVPTIANLFPTSNPWLIVVVTVAIPVLISEKTKVEIGSPSETKVAYGSFPSVLGV